MGAALCAATERRPTTVHNRDDFQGNAAQVLAHLRNVVITPHSAFNTREAVGRILDTTVENLRGCAEGRPRNVVT